MRRGLAGITFCSALALGACQTIIGISDYEIDSSLDDAAGESSGGSASMPAEGGDGGGGGALPGPGGQAGAAPEGGGGAAGGASRECSKDADCDDTVDCTQDSCDESGQCLHAADDLKCLPDPGECLKCRLGIGCVASAVLVEELLADPALDQAMGDWIEYSDNNVSNIFVEDGAESGTRIARFGPAPPDATAEEYADLSQSVTIPDKTTRLTLTGYYQLTPGVTAPAADYLVAALYELGELEPFTTFHSWPGSSGAQTVWKSFSYDAPRSEVLAAWGQEYTFDLVAHTVGSVYRFDTLSLRATVCE